MNFVLRLIFMIGVWTVGSLGSLSQAIEPANPDLFEFTATADRPAGSWVCGSLPLATDLGDARELVLTRIDTGATLPAQRSAIRPERVCFRLDGPLRAADKRSYRVAVAEEPRAAPVTARLADGKLTVSAGDQAILTYHVKTAEPPEGAPRYFRRSGFIHPLRTPGGQTVTDGFPPDHFHQHGVFRAWVKTKFRGEAIDFWNQKKQTGDVRHAGEPVLASGSLFAEFSVDLEHCAMTEKSPNVVVLKETWWVCCHPQADRFEVDLESVQRVATSDPLLIEQNKYGGFAVRGRRNWTDDSRFTFLTSEGKGRIEGNHTRPRWVRMLGPADDGLAYCVVLSSPDNFRSPQPVRLHPVMPYFVFAPMVVEEFQITDKKPHVARFRLITGDGEPSSETIEGWWREYAHSLRQ